MSSEFAHSEREEMSVVGDDDRPLSGNYEVQRGRLSRGDLFIELSGTSCKTESDTPTICRANVVAGIWVGVGLTATETLALKR